MAKFEPAEGEPVGAPPELCEEYKMLEGLRHPNIVTVYALIGQGEHFAMVMECASTCLESELGNIPDEMKWNLLWQVSSGLGFLHSKNILHLDLKPANILISGTYPDETAPCQAKLCLGRIMRAQHYV